MNTFTPKPTMEELCTVLASKFLLGKYGKENF